MNRPRQFPALSRLTGKPARRTCRAPLRAALLLAALGHASGGAAVTLPPPAVAAEAHLLVDAGSGYVLSEHNADQPMAPASLTKLMTSYVLAHELAEGRVSNADQVLISREAWAQNPEFAGSSLMWIEVGKRVSLADLHLGVVVSSGNDASVAIAEHVAGSEAAFAEYMNRHARELGMAGSHFVNSHGLSAENHYTTARDLVTISKALISRFPEEYALYKLPEFTFNNIRQYNRNSLLAEDPSVDGLKTGYTADAGYCLVTSARRGNMRLVSVVLGAASERSRKVETRKLLNFGFRFYENHALYSSGEQLVRARVWKGRQREIDLAVAEPVHITIPRGRHNDVQAVMEVSEPIEAPLSAGQPLGKVIVRLEGELLAEQDLVATSAVAPADFPGLLRDTVTLLFRRFQ